MARYFRLPFANSGDKDPLPDETVNSLVSYATGYSQDYQRNPASDPLARRMERNFFNQLMFDVTDTLKELYETGTVPFITSTDNNGAAFGYAIGARVLRNNRIYENTTANNTRTPPASGWVLVDAAGLRTLFIEPGEFGLGDFAPGLSNLNIPESNRETRINSFTSTDPIFPPVNTGTVFTVVRTTSAGAATAKTQLAVTGENELFIRVFNIGI